MEHIAINMSADLDCYCLQLCTQRVLQNVDTFS